jgi:hypothetical protein
MKSVFGYDFDGVVSIGITPSSSQDVVITGRCLDESEIVFDILKKRNILCNVYLNPMLLAERGNHTESSRILSAHHKAKTITVLEREKICKVVRFFEDDPLQLDILKKFHPDLEYVFIESNLVQK